MIDKIKFLPEGLGIGYKFSICFSKFKISFLLTEFSYYCNTFITEIFPLKSKFIYINFETQEYQMFIPYRTLTTSWQPQLHVCLQISLTQYGITLNPPQIWEWFYALQTASGWILYLNNWCRGWQHSQAISVCVFSWTLLLLLVSFV